MNLELKLKLVTTSPGGWWVGGWTKTKLMLFSTQVEVEVGAELSLAIEEGKVYSLKINMILFSNF